MAKKIKKDDGCAGCLTAKKKQPCRAHGCTKWCGKHIAHWLEPKFQKKAFNKTKAVKELATLTFPCRSCNKPMQASQRSGHKVWFECVNMHCEKNKKQPRRW